MLLTEAAGIYLKIIRSVLPSKMYQKLREVCNNGKHWFIFIIISTIVFEVMHIFMNFFE